MPNKATTSKPAQADLTIKDYQKPVDLVAMEHQVLDFWDQTKAFQQSISNRPQDKPYIFYDGPPFATGLPHYGHILASTAKDVIPRYWTMKGYRVERVWGWDCHGIPIENIVEGELGFKGGKKDIEEYGIDRFNAACRAAILRFDKEWERVIHRIGRWVDFKHSYKTMDASYMESVWWAFKKLYDKGLIYEGKKVILYCPRCSTPLSNFEIAMDNSYKDVDDPSLTIKFALKGKKNEYLLAWTTTPWTLLGNVALAVNSGADYIKVEQGGDILYLAKERAEVLRENYRTLNTLKGKDLVGLEYQPLFPYLDTGGKKAFYVASADFVSLEEGTGIVHTAAIYGEDDYQLAVELDLPLVPMLDDQGLFMDAVTPVQGQFFKKAESWVIDDLDNRRLLYANDTVRHSYPFCYRCDTRLFYNAIPAWFVDIAKLKPDLKKHNRSINWYPGHLKYGRFGKGLETAPDWNISRSRYWGTPMPIWVGDKTGQTRVIGSIKELKQWAVNQDEVKDIKDLHREHIDHIKVYVDKTKKEPGTRIKEVFDCWVESGSMPYASIHYPFDHKDKFEHSYPAQYIVEYIAQTRAWFYTLHVMSVGLFDQPAFENAVTTGNIQAQDGQKMSKSKKNFPDPEPFFEKYGVDALRFYLMASAVMKGDNTNFSEQEVKETYQKVINLLWNVFVFYKSYAPDQPPSDTTPRSSHILDRWILSRTHSLVQGVTESLDNYNTTTTCRLIRDYISDLSTWYLRRSRNRLKTDPQAVHTLGWTLRQIALVTAPVTPFISELIFHNLSGKDHSVHLENWPLADPELIDPDLELQMNLARKIVEGLHSLRQTHGIRVRQPLAAWSIDSKSAPVLTNKLELMEVISQETNIKNYTPGLDTLPGQHTDSLDTGYTSDHGPLTVIVDLEITPQLENEGRARELIRQIQSQRKKLKVGLDQPIYATLPKDAQDLGPELLTDIQAKTLTQKLSFGGKLKVTSASS